MDKKIKPAWMLIRKDEGHILVEGVWEVKKDCLDYLKNIIPEDIKELYSYLKTPVVVTLEGAEDDYELVAKTNDKLLISYEYEIIEGKINIGFHDPNWYENR